MNRLHYSILSLFLSFFLFTHFAAAQQYSQCMQVIGVTGKAAKRDGMHFTYTVGEAFTMTLTGGVNKMTQGFHQPDVCIIVSTDDVDLADWNIEVFPNPATDWLTVRFAADQSHTLRASVFTALGRAVLSDVPLTQPEGSSLDCS
ncbi:MAG TPA: hypothetical protein PKD78_09765, partial [Saprospiraceae bacterium]|nr:hypothetical protein [Saprospiraceae bacterium]